MPSASAKLEKQVSTDALDPMKQVLTIVEKKVRNLEKRKGKLDSYRHDSANGKELNDDQKKAVAKYDQVVEILDFAKELQKQFQTLIQEYTKAQKKAAKREQLERQQLELQRIKEIMVYQDLLNSMGGEDVRQDFLNGNNGAVKLTEEELNSLDELYKAICPEREADSENSSNFDQVLSAAAEHVQALLDAKNKEVFGTTYKSLKETLQKIYTCTYFNKTDTIPNETESNTSLSEEKENEPQVFVEPQYGQSSDGNQHSEVEDSVLPQQSGLPTAPTERSYYQIESSSLYTEQNHPIQEVLSVQGNLNFLQESQIEINSSQPITSSGLTSQHRTRRPSEEAAAMSSHPPPGTGNLVLPNSASLQPQQVAQNIPASVPMQPTSQAIDFDPARPIPTQTYTNQSFSSAIHPMMAAAVSQNYVPVTLSHGIPPQHVLPSNIVVQPLPPRSTVSSMASNPNTLPMTPTHTSQLNTEIAQPACAPASQYECNEIQESNIVKNASATFGNCRDTRSGARETRSRSDSNEYSRNSNQVGYGSDRAAYQSTNNSQAYMNRENFSDTSSYSSNLKRGLNSRGGARGSNAARGTSNNRSSRGGYRN
ncbi:caprin-1-like isoform X2 [Stegodyphus dumicola]|uniref:caprin-1-like isoform X2 n=1 Tax=Stegodyphus dumicola TaxID=202533 RepID=UPI0015AFD4E2|nr:caprin-1-like isoform X2 [Stegodyphus dumicola]